MPGRRRCFAASFGIDRREHPGAGTLEEGGFRKDQGSDRHAEEVPSGQSMWKNTEYIGSHHLIRFLRQLENKAVFLLFVHTASG